MEAFPVVIIIYLWFWFWSSQFMEPLVIHSWYLSLRGQTNSRDRVDQLSEIIAIISVGADPDPLTIHALNLKGVRTNTIPKGVTATLSSRFSPFPTYPNKARQG